MGQEHFLAEAGDIGVLFAFWSCVLFFMLLPTFFRWWESKLGYAIASLDLLLGAAFTPGAVRLMFRISFGSLVYGWVVVVVVWLIALRLPWLLWVLFRLQTEGMKPWDSVKEWVKGLPGVLAAPWRRAGRRARRW